MKESFYLILTHGIRVVLILVGAWILIRIINIFLSRFFKKLVKKGISIGKVGDIKLEEKRLETLKKVSYSILKVVVWLIAIITILPEFGIEITPILTGIGIGGLALGLGARSLISDYLSGFFILLEDQYRVGEKVELAGIKGEVRDFNLRRTVIKDENGVFHYIPNSQVKTASNFSRKE